MSRSTRFHRSVRRFVEHRAAAPALLCVGLVGSLLGCGGSTSTEDLRAWLDACRSSVDVPATVGEADAECALACLDRSDCGELAAAKGGDSSTDVGICLESCQVDLFPDTPEITFGADQGTLSSSAAELLGKPAGNPDPETLVGVYEYTGFGSEEHPEDYLVLSNDWRMRYELRQSGIAMGGECKIDVGGASSDKQTMQVFVSSPIEVHDWGFKILEAHKDEKHYTAFGFDVSCSVELQALDSPFCLQEGGVPKGYSTCVTVRSGYLTFVNVDGTSGTSGKKISN